MKIGSPLCILSLVLLVQIGQMSAWYLFSALGFYPACQASPLMCLAVLPSAKRQCIDPTAGQSSSTHTNSSKSKVFIQSAKLNRQEHTQTWFSHSAIINGESLLWDPGQTRNGVREDAPFLLQRCVSNYLNAPHPSCALR